MEPDGVDAPASARTDAASRVPAPGRRDALKKGAAAAAVGAVAWSAPRIEGLSVVPDYASAGTNTTPVITFHLDGNGPGLAGYVNYMNAGASPAYTINQNGPSANATITMVAPLGPAGNATFTFPSGQDTDGPAVSAGVNFNIDPPFNKCVIISAVADWDGSTSDRGTTTAPFTNQSPNITSPRFIPLTFPPGESSAGNSFFNPAVKLNFIDVSIQCQ
jgi:hypothetical protein